MFLFRLQMRAEDKQPSNCLLLNTNKYRKTDKYQQHMHESCLINGGVYIICHRWLSQHHFHLPCHANFGCQSSINLLTTATIPTWCFLNQEENKHLVVNSQKKSKQTKKSDFLFVSRYLLQRMTGVGGWKETGCPAVLLRLH